MLLAVPKVASELERMLLNQYLMQSRMETWLLNSSHVLWYYTASNNGHKNGACTILEKNFFDRELLWLACHHTMEIILAEVFSLCTSASFGPNIQIFKNNWNGIERSNFKSLETDDWDETCYLFKNK